jgi:predicted dehydrogenase
VAVLTRHHLHGKQTVAALKAGKHVFSEKPLALIDKEINSIERALATKNAPMLVIGFNRRFAPLSRQLVKFLEPRTHPVAAHYRVNAGSLPLEHWLHDPQVGGGRLVGEGCHFIDYLVFLAGSKPVSVTAQALPDEGQFRQDNVQVTFRFANGSLGTLTYLANGDRALPKERLEVFSGGKTAVLDDFRSLDLSEGGRTKGLRMSQDKGHREIWRAFITASQKGGNPPIPYAELFSGARATLAALKSLEIGGEVLL